MTINYDNRVFRVRSNSGTGEVDGETRFYYHQDGRRLTGTYEGGSIRRGHLLGRVHPDGRLEFLYHHETVDGTLQSGRCESTPRRTEDGQLVLHETWRWLTGDRSSGTSVLVEVERPETPAHIIF